MTSFPSDEGSSEISNEKFFFEDTDPYNCSSVYVLPGNRDWESNRLSTFYKFPNTVVSPAKLAHCGFYYTGIKDQTKCFSCGATMQGWTIDHDPTSAEWHRLNCKMVLGKDNENVPMFPLRPIFSDMPKQSTDDHLAFLNSLDLRKEVDRIKTFATWTDHTVHRSDLARCGFFCLGDNNMVQCFSCNTILSQLNYGDNVAEEHQNKAPLCKMVKGIEEENIPLEVEDRELVPSYVSAMEPPDPSMDDQAVLMRLYPLRTPKVPHMKDETKRLETFQQWPSTEGCATPQDISRAGFYYFGRERLVVCWYCGGGISMDPYDEPWTEHAKYMPECHFLLLRKGLGFPQEMFVKFPNIERIDLTPATESTAIPPPPQIIDQAEEYLSQEQLLCNAMSSIIVTYAIRLGLDENVVELAVRKKLEDGSEYNSVAKLLDDVIAIQDGSDNSEIEESIDGETSKLTAQLEQLKRDNECKICLTKPATVGFKRCQHLCTCIDCAKQLQKCPICRTVIESSSSFYRS